MRSLVMLYKTTQADLYIHQRVVIWSSPSKRIDKRNHFHELTVLCLGYL